jgi:hypothetical protein
MRAPSFTHTASNDQSCTASFSTWLTVVFQPAGLYVYIVYNVSIFNLSLQISFTKELLNKKVSLLVERAYDIQTPLHLHLPSHFGLHNIHAWNVHYHVVL